MVLIPGDSIPLAIAGSTTKTGQDIKRSVETKLPPMPWDFKPTGLGVPPPETILQDIEMRVREIISYPLRIIESQFPPPHQLARIIVARKPLNSIEEHVDTVPTPLQVLQKFPPFKDFPTPRDFAVDAERAVTDTHHLMEDQHQNFQENVPVLVENAKQAQADLTALRHVGVEMAQAGSKTMVRVGKSMSKMFEELADGGLAGLVL